LLFKLSSLLLPSGIGTCTDCSVDFAVAAGARGGAVIDADTASRTVEGSVTAVALAAVEEVVAAVVATGGLGLEAVFSTDKRAVTCLANWSLISAPLLVVD